MKPRHGSLIVTIITIQLIIFPQKLAIGQSLNPGESATLLEIKKNGQNFKFQANPTENSSNNSQPLSMSLASTSWTGSSGFQPSAEFAPSTQVSLPDDNQSTKRIDSPSKNLPKFIFPTKLKYSKDSIMLRPKEVRVMRPSSNSGKLPNNKLHYVASASTTQVETPSTSGLIFPDDAVNEVQPNSLDYSSPSLHGRDNYYSQYHQPQHDYHYQQQPIKVVQEAHPVRQTSWDDDSGLAPALNRALKFFIPTALFLTGASVLFPKRVKVPTAYNEMGWSMRPKRSTHYAFTAGDVEEIFPEIPRSEKIKHLADYNDEILRHSSSETEERAYPVIPRFKEKLGQKFINKLSLQSIQSDLPESAPGSQTRASSSEWVDQQYQPRRNRKLIVTINRKNNTTTNLAPSTIGGFPVADLEPLKKGSKTIKTPAPPSQLPKKSVLTPTAAQDILLRPFHGAATILDSYPRIPVSDKSKFPEEKSKNVLKQLSASEKIQVTTNIPPSAATTFDYELESEACQKRALCELGIRGINYNATRFENFMWSMATLTPTSVTDLYNLHDTFGAIRDGQCSQFNCPNPNMDIQE